jgi:hypothetical protein
MWSKNLLQMNARVFGERGELRVLNPVMLPQLFHRLTVRTPDVKRV